MSDCHPDGAEVVLRQWAEAINQRDLAAVQRTLHPDYTDDLFNSRETVQDFPWWEGSRAAALWPYVDLAHAIWEVMETEAIVTNLHTSLGNPHVAPVRGTIRLRRTNNEWLVSEYRLIDLHLPDQDEDFKAWKRVTDARNEGVLPEATRTPAAPAGVELNVRIEKNASVPTLHINDRPDSAQMMMCFNPRPNFYRYFAEQNVQWVSFDSTPTAHDWKVVKTVWTGENEFDFSQLDEDMNLLLSENPHAILLPMVFFGTPPWWAEAHPDHVMRYETSQGKLLPVKILGRKVASFISPLWREGCLKALDRYLEHVESQPYGKRIGGYYITGGSGGEEWFQYWGPEGEFTDYSEANLKGFTAWLQEKYKTEAALRKSWGRKDVTFAGTEIPPTYRRREFGGCSFHHPTKDRDILDLMQYTGDVVSGTLELFARHIKKKTGGTKLTGAFFGYINSIASEPREHDSGHLGIPKILKCPYLDFLSSPSAYTQRRPGIGYRKTMGATDSLKLHGKLWWNQMDDRTFRAASMVTDHHEKHLPYPERMAARRRTRLATINSYHGVADSLEETLQAQWAVFAQTLVTSIGNYWFDMQGGWYDDVTLMKTIRQMKSIADLAVHQDRTPIHDIAFVVSSDSRRFSKQNSHLTIYLVEALQYYLGKMGLPYNFYLLEDINLIPPHKLWIFANAFHVTQDQERLIAEKTDGSDVIWFHGAGYVAESEHSLSSASRVTGIQLGLVPEGDFPQIQLLEAPATEGLWGMICGQGEWTLEPGFYVDDPDAMTLGMLTDSFRPGFSVKETPRGRRYFSTVPMMAPGVLRNIARIAGAHVYTETNDTVFANHSFVAVSNTEPGNCLLRLPRQTEVVDVVSGEVLTPRQQQIEFACGPKETRILFLGGEDQWKRGAERTKEP